MATKFKIEDFEKLINNELDNVKTDSDNRITAMFIEGTIGGILMLVNKLVKRFAKQPSVFHWLYEAAYREILADRARHLAQHHGPDSEGIYTIRIVRGDDGRPALDIARAIAKPLPSGGYHVAETERYSPDPVAQRFIKWYEGRKSPSVDFTKLWLLIGQKEAEQKAHKPA